MASNAKDYALVVGFDHYPDYGANGRPLKGAIRDATEMWSWLGDEQHGGGVPASNRTLITSSVDTVNPPQPRKGAIDDALVKIHKAVKNSGGRRFYFYFSGHGQSQSMAELALCMPNWSRDRPAAALSLRKYLVQICECMEFDEVFILLDCCRSRKVKARAQDTELGCAKPHGEAGKTKRFIAFATEFQTPAFEASVGGTEDDDEPIVRGHFSEALLAALRGAAAGPDGGVSALDLGIYLEKVVPRIALRHRHQQSPKIEMAGMPLVAADGPILGSAPRIPTVDLRVRFKDSRQGTVVLEGPDLTEIHKGDVATGPWEETLPIATHLLSHVESGETMDLHLEPHDGILEIEF